MDIPFHRSDGEALHFLRKGNLLYLLQSSRVQETWRTALQSVPFRSDIQDFPNLRGTAYTIVVMSLLNSFKVFREAWLVAGDYPHESMYLLQHLYSNWFRELDFDKIAAASVMTSVVVFLLIGFLRKAWDGDK